MLSEPWKNSVAVLFLLVTAWASLATSSPHKSIDNNDLYISSDCVNPIFDRQVRSANGVLVSGVDYTNIGFPTSTIHLGQDSSGPYFNGTYSVSRQCTETYGNNESGDGKYIYSCFDNGAFACTILIIQL